MHPRAGRLPSREAGLWEEHRREPCVQEVVGLVKQRPGEKGLTLREGHLLAPRGRADCLLPPEGKVEEEKCRGLTVLSGAGQAFVQQLTRHKLQKQVYSLLPGRP